MPHLFSPLALSGLTLRNRIMLSPMCMYQAADDGLLTDWHLAHYVTRAVGGAGLVLTEATGIEPRGRISQADLGLWNDAQVERFARLVRLVQAEGAAIGVQLAHAGRKAYSRKKGHGPEPTVAPSALPFDEGWRTPRELTGDEIDQLVDTWRAAAVRAEAAGFDVVEIHSAHGYLSHEFLSPISNHRKDEYGGSLANRMWFLLRVVEAVREVWPEEKPLFVRVSATDHVAGGLTLDEVIAVARELKGRGVDLVDCSSGGLVSVTPLRLGPGYQVPFAERIRREAGIPVAAVGLITSPELADAVVRNGRADLVALGRELLRHPFWPLHAARMLGHDITWPEPYRQARLD